MDVLMTKFVLLLNSKITQTFHETTNSKRDFREFFDDIGKKHTHKFAFRNICEKKSFTEYIILPQEDILVLLEQRKNFADDFIFLDFQNI